MDSSQQQLRAYRGEERDERVPVRLAVDHLRGQHTSMKQERVQSNLEHDTRDTVRPATDWALTSCRRSLPSFHDSDPCAT